MARNICPVIASRTATARPPFIRRGEVPVAQGGQGGEAEVLERLGVRRLPASEKASAAEVLDRGVEGGEHHADEHVSAQGTVDTLHGDRGLGQYPAEDEDHGQQQDQPLPDRGDAVTHLGTGQGRPEGGRGASQRHARGQPRPPATYPRCPQGQQQEGQEQQELEIDDGPALGERREQIGQDQHQQKKAVPAAGFPAAGTATAACCPRLVSGGLCQGAYAALPPCSAS